MTNKDKATLHYNLISLFDNVKTDEEYLDWLLYANQILANALAKFIKEKK